MKQSHYYYRKALDPSCFADSESIPTKEEYVRALQAELGIEQTGVMTTELLSKIDGRLGAIGDKPTADDENFVSQFQALFDLGGISERDAEAPLKISLQVFTRSMSGRGVSVPAAAHAAGESGQRFFNAYRGARGATGGSVIEIVGGHLGVNSECASLTKALTDVGSASGWRRGDQVMGNNALRPGTAIATFNFSKGPGDRGYGPAEHPGGWYGVSHTAVYLGQNKDGMYVLDQYNRSAGAQVRFLRFDDPGAEGASRFFAINTPGHAGAHVAASLPPAATKYASNAGVMPPSPQGHSNKGTRIAASDKLHHPGFTAHA